MVVIARITESGLTVCECGGSLVTEKHVITAAHCVVDSNNIALRPKQIEAILNVYDLNKINYPGVVIVGVKTVQPHEHYDPDSKQNDIAILRLRKSVLLSDNIAPICLPYNSLRYEDLAGKTSTVIGFGVTSEDGSYSDVLLEVSFKILDQEDCSRIHESDFPITSDQFCAGTLDGSRDACEGDSGGPLMILGNDNRYYLIGVVSFGINCAHYGETGVYTRVTEFLDWLTPKLAY